MIAALLAVFLVLVLPSTAPPEKEKTGQEIQRLEQELARAVVAIDVDTIRRIESSSYVYTGSDAGVGSREDFIKAYEAGTGRVRSLTFDDLIVDAYGDAAVVRGVQTVDRVTDGVSIRRVSRYTRFYVRFPQGWQAVAGHSSAMKSPEERRAQR